MEIKQSEILEIGIADEANVLYARRLFRNFFKSLGFIDFDLDKMELVVSELGTNIVKYGVRGIITAKRIKYLSHTGIEIIAKDRGKGISNIMEFLNKKPVINTSSSLKSGLSAIYNLTDEFEYLNSENGTTITLRKWLPFNEATLKYSVISRPKPGELKNGDAFFIKQLPQFSFFCVIDALGHGEQAAATANIAMDCIKLYYYLPLSEIFLKCHEHLDHSHGIAISICKIYTRESKMEYVGVGDVKLRVFGAPESLRIFNHNGTVGMNMEPIKLQTYKYFSGSTFIMHTDGIADFELNQDTLRLIPQAIASFVMEKEARSSDDATVLVAR